ncbi:glycoside hydrolase family 25 protein [Burkholderia stagnalis]|uniref:glycoside hydrolase family 25 protein n=1 Tax=Burkholderia stagnalis TaxID=1503054 RepID=UPI0009C01255|nr:GH25 family lysozyme [Burkholderia stagnalis]
MRIRSFIIASLIPRAVMAGPSPCEIVQAPAKFPIAATHSQHSWRPVNSGIKPSGFVGLGSSTPVVHGIDVSKYQDSADFGRAFKCGARFAYVRLSGGINLDNELMYRVHWANARASGLMVGPYHNLSPTLAADINSKENVLATATSGSETGLALESVARANAEMQAENFLSRLHEVLSLDPRPDRISGRSQPSFLPIVLDLSADPVPNVTLAKKQSYGHIYGLMACTWIDRVARSGYPRSKVVLFVSAHIYKEYSLANAPCDLSSLPIWIYHRPLDGSGLGNAKNFAEVNDLRALCSTKNGTNRCLFDQYTSYGGFAAFAVSAPLDLDRFHGTETALKSWLQTEGAEK